MVKQNSLHLWTFYIVGCNEQENVFLLIANPLMLHAWQGKLTWQMIIVEGRLSQEQHLCFVHCVT